VSHIDLVDQTFRDGQQCLWGMRLRTGMVTPVARELDTAGYSAIDITGSSMFECVLRYSREDPWEGLDHWRRAMPRTEFRSGVGSNRIVKFGLSPDAILDLWVQTLIKHGMGSFWVYDCLYNLDQMKRLCDTIHAAGAKALGAIFYGISPVHTDEWFAARVRQYVDWGITDAIYVEDAAGIMKPERAKSLIPALIEAAGDIPIEMQCHNTVGVAGMNYLIGVEAGVRVLHTAPGPMANGPSLPSTEQTVENLRWEGHTTKVDLDRVQRISAHMRRVAEQEGHVVGVPNEYNVFPYHHQLPGGMTGTLRAQLAQYDMSDRFDEVLEEIVHVREELGHPISATPFSQLMGIQSVLNVITGERYGSVPDEVLCYVLGHLGRPPAPIDPDVLDRMLSTDRGREMQAWVPPQPTIRELKEQYGDRTMTDEELLRRYLVPLQDVEATHAAGAAARTYQLEHDGVPESLINDLLAGTRIGFAEIESGGFSVTLRR
jgi:oxaloacetate decarboxylase (Na+ extruding) subunit alpha